MSFGGFGQPKQSPQELFAQEMSFKLVYATISDCFENCVNDFSQNKLSSTEERCIKNCGNRFMIQ